MAAATIRAIGIALRSGHCSARDLTEATLERIERLDSVVGSYVLVDHEGARRSAVRLDRELGAGRDRGPLHGIPVGLKDVIDVAGLPTTAGSRVLAGNIPSRSAPVTRLLRTSGAIVLGKLAMTEFATGSSDQPATGPTRNPWDPSRIPGGSSSGSAAAVAAGLALAAIGTDTAGSIRSPAGMCGVVGIRPTRGRVSAAGIVPLARSLDCVGPLARSVDDAGTVLAAIGIRLARRGDLFAEPDPGRLRGGRVGVLRGSPWDDVHADVAASMDVAIRALTAAGMRVDDLVMDVAAAAVSRRVVQYAEAAAFHREWLADRPGDYDPSVLALLRMGQTFGQADIAQARRHLATVRRAALTLFTAVDYLIAPTAPEPAWTFAEARASKRLSGFVLTAPVSAMGLPAVSVPGGFSSGGLPLGIQVIGRPDDEVGLLDLAMIIERVVGGPSRLPVTPEVP